MNFTRSKESGRRADHPAPSLGCLFSFFSYGVLSNRTLSTRSASGYLSDSTMSVDCRDSTMSVGASVALDGSALLAE